MINIPSSLVILIIFFSDLGVALENVFFRNCILISTNWYLGEFCWFVGTCKIFFAWSLVKIKNSGVKCLLCILDHWHWSLQHNHWHYPQCFSIQPDAARSFQNLKMHCWKNSQWKNVNTNFQIINGNKHENVFESGVNGKQR